MNDMALVRVFYEEDYGEPTGLLYLETQSKRVEWDGLTLKVGRRVIQTKRYFKESLKKNGMGYWGGFTDIYFLEIDGVVFIDDIELGQKRNGVDSVAPIFDGSAQP